MKIIKQFVWILFFVVVFSSCVFFIYHYKNYSFITISLKTLKHNSKYYFIANIEEKDLPIEIDTGSFKNFSLHKKFLDKIKNKKELDVISYWTDINGNKYEGKQYIVETVRMCRRLKLLNPTIEEEDKSFLSKGCIIEFNDLALTKELSKDNSKSKEKIAGRMGISSLRVFPLWLFDFPRSRLVAIFNLKDTMEKLNLSLKNFTETSLNPSYDHLVISINTDVGRQNFIVDTGAEVTFGPKMTDIETEWETFSNFIINEKNFGPFEVLLFNHSFPLKNVDGFLGMDFLRDRAILIDFENNKIFFGEKEDTNSIPKERKIVSLLLNPGSGR